MSGALAYRDCRYSRTVPEASKGYGPLEPWFWGRVYEIEHIPTGRRYIGCTIFPPRIRWRQHLNGATSRPIKEILQAGGAADLRMRVIFTSPSMLAARAMERAEIIRQRTVWPDGLNVGRPKEYDGQPAAPSPAEGEPS